MPQQATQTAGECRVRRSNADRTRETRGKLVDAAIALIDTKGYGAATTTNVAEKAGVSRGAFLHHFPTKVDLMIAVAEFAVDRHMRSTRRDLAAIPLGIERFMALTDATWRSLCTPPLVAFFELLVASRSDDELRERFLRVFEDLERRQLEGVWELASACGFSDRQAVDTMCRLHLAAMRSLVVERRLGRDVAEVDDCVKHLRAYKVAFVAEQTGRSAV